MDNLVYIIDCIFFEKGEVKVGKKVFRFTFIPCSFIDIIGISYLYVDSLK